MRATASLRDVAKERPLFFEWSFPGAPVQILLKLDLVPRILSHLLETADAGGRGRETGGFLIGTPLVNGTEITGFEPYRCESSEDSLLTAAARDPQRVRALLRRYKRGKTQVVGYARSQLGDNLSLTKEDFVLIKGFFQDPSSVFLLVGPDGDQGYPNGGFFFWSEGDVAQDAYMPFPFDQRLLESEARQPRFLQNEDTEPPRQQASRRNVWLVAVGLILVAMMGVWAGTTLRRTNETSAVAAASHDGTSMALSARDIGSEMMIHWDPNSDPVKNARVGLLTLRLDDKVEEIPLTADILREGKLIQKNKGKKVRITLQLFLASGGSTLDDLIVLLNGSPDPSAPVDTSPPEELPKATPPSVVVETTPAAPPKAPLKRFVLPSEQARSKASPDVFAALPPPVLDTPQLRVPIPDATVVVPPPRESKPPERVEAASLTPPLPVAIPPKPVHQVRPELSANLRAMVVRATDVQIRVTVDSSGKVTQVEPLPGKGAIAEYLRNAASSAARLWRFEPARANGKPIPGELVLQFRFAPGKD